MKTANEYGHEAQRKGLPRSPLTDSAFVEDCLKDAQVGEVAASLNAWLDGWDRAHLTTDRVRSISLIMELLRTYRIDAQRAYDEQAFERYSHYNGRLSALSEALDAFGYRGPRTQWAGFSIFVPTDEDITPYC